MEPASPSCEMTVEIVLRDWPATIEVFLARRLACIGCPMARFCTLDDVARAYKLSREALMAALIERAGDGGPDREACYGRSE
jgi:hybrid cluster-associated redox disulfide protein